METTLEDDQPNMLLDNVQKAPIKASNKDGQLSDTMALDWLKRSSLQISVVFFLSIIKLTQRIKYMLFFHFCFNNESH